MDNGVCAREHQKTDPQRPAPFADASFDVVAMGSSAGGLAALSDIVAGLPRDFPAAVVIVQHLDPRHRSLMVEILSRRTSLRLKQAEHGEALQGGTVYTAPPDFHLLVSPRGTVELTHSELVHYLRPSADLLFESVAGAFGHRAIGVVLTGTGKDGSSGIKAIKERGGTTIAQDEATAEFFGMPHAAIETGAVDYVLPLPEIPVALVSLVMHGGVIE